MKQKRERKLINRCFIVNTAKAGILLLLLAILIAPTALFAQAKVGTAGMQFLKVGVGARAVAMGEAFTAVSDDASALFYNPSGLIKMTTPNAIFSYVDYPAGLKFVYIGALTPTPQTSGVLGFHITSMFTDEMTETTPEMPYGTGRTFTASDLAVSVSYCQRLTDKFSVGANLKLLNEQLADKSATGWAADVGTYYETGWQEMNIGMVIQNFGPDMNFVNDPFPLPMSFKFGASIVALNSGMYRWLIAGDFIHPNDNIELYQIGTELTAINMIAFRLGKKFNAFKRDSWEDYQKDRINDPFVEYPIIDEDGKISLDGMSFGLGLKLIEHGLTFDYAWAGQGTLGSVHRFTLGYNLSGLFQ